MNRANSETKRAEEGECPIAIALHEIVVHGDDMHLLLFARGEVTREWSDDCLAFACLHFRDLAFRKHNATDQLHIEWSSAKGRTRHRIDRANRGIDLVRNIEIFPASEWSGTADQIALRIAWLSRAHGCDSCVVLRAHL